LKVDPKNPDWEDRDRFILSKGHCALGYIPTLAMAGFLDEAGLKTFNHFKSPYGMHPDSLKVRGCDASTGSLGHGLPMAAGMALGARMQGKDFKVVCLLGDGECGEGSNWEAAMTINHYKLTNVITIVDRNKLMIDGRTEDVMALEPFADKWKAFGFEVIEIDGHDFEQICAALDKAWKATKPVCIIANTIKGKGVDYMEDDVKWHYGSIDSSLADKARESIKNTN
jgi:transketolase